MHLFNLTLNYMSLLQYKKKINQLDEEVKNAVAKLFPSSIQTDDKK